MKIHYLGKNDPKNIIDLPSVTTQYERIACAYPDREARYCFPPYHDGKNAKEPIAVWQYEAKGHAPKTYGVGDEGRSPVAVAPDEELHRLSAEITAALDHMRDNPEAYPEYAGYFESCLRYGKILAEIDAHYQAAASYDANAAVSIARSVIGRRRIISRAETADLISALRPVDMQRIEADAWAKMPNDITFVSLVGGGCMRYDQPGSMSVMQRRMISFVGCGMPHSSVDYIRRHADIVVKVR